jgi:hypothetical protein
LQFRVPLRREFQPLAMLAAGAAEALPTAVRPMKGVTSQLAGDVAFAEFEGKNLQCWIKSRF